MDKEFRDALMKLRFNYKYKIERGLKTYAEYKAERRRIIKESRERDAKYWNAGYKKWMDLKLGQRHVRGFYKRAYEDALKKKKPQSKLDKFISQKD